MEGEQRPVAFIILPWAMLDEEQDGLVKDFQEAVEDAELEPHLHDPSRPWGKDLVASLIGDILRSQIVIVDITAFEPYVVYALGIAMTLHRHIILLVEDRPHFPDLLSSEFHISYTNTSKGTKLLRKRLTEAVQMTLQNPENYANKVQQHLPPPLREALRDPTHLASLDASKLTEQNTLVIVEQRLNQIEQRIQAQVQPRAVNETLVFVNELRASLDEMIRKRDEAEYYMHRLEHERDTMLFQVAQVSVILEEHRSPIPYPRTLPDHAELVFVPAGLIVPGGRRVSEEERQRDQRFVRSFYLDRYPVTNAQFAHFVKATGYETVAEQLNREQGCNDPTWRMPAGAGSTLEQRGDHPVVWVYREDARRYAKWAGRRLPTRLEWERAMRGLDGHTWPWGDDWRDHACNLSSTGTTPVNAFPSGASPVGCFDMVGNVWEWLDNELAGGKLMLMGGSWAEPGMNVGYKVLVVPSDGTDGAAGFRCAMDVPTRTNDE
jgi:formylglycine-generating enzyme required for sulfatase activity